MSIINYENLKASEDAAALKSERDKENASVYGEILNRWTIRDTAANYNIIAGWCNPITLAGFEALLRKSPKSLDMVSREWLIKDIVDHSHGDKGMLRDLSIRLSTYSLAQLRQKRRDIDFKSQVHTKDDAAKFLANQRAEEAAKQKYPGWPIFPKSGWSKDGGPLRQVAFDIPYLKSLDAFELRRLHRLYGPYLDDRLAGRD